MLTRCAAPVGASAALIGATPATVTVTAAGTPGPGRSASLCRSCEPDPPFPTGCWSGAGGPSRRWSRCSPPAICSGCRPAGWYELTPNASCEGSVHSRRGSRTRSQSEVQRLEALGAIHYDDQQERGHDFWVLRDPLGQRVLRPSTRVPRLIVADGEHAPPCGPRPAPAPPSSTARLSNDPTTKINNGVNRKPRETRQSTGLNYCSSEFPGFCGPRVVPAAALVVRRSDRVDAPDGRIDQLDRMEQRQILRKEAANLQ